MHLLDSAQFDSFVEGKPVAAVHFDAEWDSHHRAIMRQKMLEAEEVLGDRVNPGEFDCMSGPELAKSIPILNVPSVAYYGDGKLIAVLIGTQENVRALLERILGGDSIALGDGPSPRHQAPGLSGS